MFKVIYYYYYLFFQKIFSDSEPHWSANAFLSINQIFIIVTLKDIVLRYLFCYKHDIEFDFVFMGAIFVLNFIYYETKKNGVRIVEEQPKLLNSQRLSIWYAILFTIIGYFFLYISGPILKSLGEKC